MKVMSAPMPNPLDQFCFTITTGEGLPDPTLLTSQQNGRQIEMSETAIRQPMARLSDLSLQLRYELLRSVSQRPNHGPPPNRSHKPRKVTRGQYFKGK